MVGHFSRIVCTTRTQTQTHTRTFPCCPFSVRSFRRTWRFSSPSTRTYFVFCDFICKNLRSLLSLLLLFPGECVCISKSLLSVKCSYFLRADVLLLWEFCEWIRNIYVHNGKCACNVFIDDCVFVAFKVEINKFN